MGLHLMNGTGQETDTGQETETDRQAKGSGRRSEAGILLAYDDDMVAMRYEKAGQRQAAARHGSYRFMPCRHGKTGKGTGHRQTLRQYEYRRE